MTDQTPYPYIDEQLIQDSIEPMAALGWVYHDENSMRWWASRGKQDIDVAAGVLQVCGNVLPFAVRDNVQGYIGFNTPLAAVAFLQLQGEQP